MEIAIIILALGATVLAVTSLCRRLGFPAPLVLVVVGTIASFVPAIPTIELTPELVLLGFLPPLLYAAAIRTSLVDIRANIRPIGLLAVGLVLFTMLTVGLLTWWLLPIPLAAALAFGAVVSPPDAVAATAVARRIGLPRRIVTILEGESLLNDATALVALRTAVLALAGTVSVASVGLDFLVAAGGGAVIGFAVAAVIVLLRKRLRDTVSDTLLSFMAPFLAYVPAEELHASGVIAVVVAGLVLGHKAPIVQDAQSRMSERVNWNTIQFLLENAVFLLLGLQLRWILEDVGNDDLGVGTVAVFCLGALLVAMLSRPVMLFAGRFLLRRGDETSTGEKVPWQNLAIVSWAGMRGVVTIAAAFLLPEDTPHRQTLLLGAFVVTAGTLLIQGLSLPWLARALQVRGPDAREDMLQEASVTQAAVTAGVTALGEIRRPGDSDEVIADLATQSQLRTNRLWERLGRPDGETPSSQHRRLRLGMLTAERTEMLRLRDAGTIDHEILARVMDAMDVEEAFLTVFSEDEDPAGAAALATPAAQVGDCEHLRAGVDCSVPSGPVCEACVREGTETVHLRMCLTCGEVGCCDSSVGRHAERHFTETGHPVMRSFEPGESWRWCYVDELLG
ncbi:Na+/H+ antiporter [Serinibacter arcticus]|uniref:Na+/H+ antiporter n=1 Tax=Serinibacter arcticus TaxID=1655435 RepID=A0A2U1ZV47_9MICO|nr:Na+/H+ antiporter [Serinibacter arcticus]PWD50820.1 Na+/H+ antiporter [Serinibacter arcticus]